MDKICAVISGGEYTEMNDIRDCRSIIVCDRGYEYAVRDGITPTLIIGDFDSLSCELPTGIDIVRLPIEKDDTDTMSAVRHALDLGFKHIRIYCALGGRLDHLYANIQTAAFAAERGANVKLCGKDTEIYVFSDRALTLPACEGRSLSVFSVTDISRGVSIRGAKYSLEDATVTNTFPIGTSNEWYGANDVEIEVKEGILAVMLCRMP